MSEAVGQKRPAEAPPAQATEQEVQDYLDAIAKLRTRLLELKTMALEQHQVWCPKFAQFTHDQMCKIVHEASELRKMADNRGVPPAKPMPRGVTQDCEALAKRGAGLVGAGLAWPSPELGNSRGNN